MNNNLPALAQGWRELFDVRRELEAAVEEVKAQEKKHEELILSYLDQTGQRGASIPNVGTVTRMERKTVFIADQEKLCSFMFNEMSKAQAMGAPLNNHLYTQARAAQNKFLDLAEKHLASQSIQVTTDNLNTVLRPLGLEVTSKDVLHFAKARS
ncbi:MAG: hypothetical protein LBS60_08785 [Deltaproteobacteria bacterium]|jgi:hypothetical protein|nr:hypothetical protein [Deltaproteobacteria bacterium]